LCHSATLAADINRLKLSKQWYFDMNIWGKLGKEYYTWHIENINELEEFIIEYNIDVDHSTADRMYGFDKSWYSLKRQMNRSSRQPIDSGTLHLALMSFDDFRVPIQRLHHRFTAIKAVVF
jgi:hypothetical protein